MHETVEMHFFHTSWEPKLISLLPVCHSRAYFHGPWSCPDKRHSFLDSSVAGNLVISVHNVLLTFPLLSPLFNFDFPSSFLPSMFGV